MNLGSIDPRDLRPTRDIVFEILRKAILNGLFSKGERIMETKIAEDLDISRTPVREAFRKLELEGLTEYYPKKGTIVKGITKEDIAEIYDMREVLEGLAVRLACKNISETEMKNLKETLYNMEQHVNDKDDSLLYELHDKYNNIILNASKNKRLIESLLNLYEYITSFRKITLSRNERRTISLAEHKRIAELIELKKPEQAEECCKEHIRKAKETILSNLN